jgi:hypothetical protein
MRAPDWSDYVRQARQLVDSDPENKNKFTVSVPAPMLVAEAKETERLRADVRRLSSSLSMAEAALDDVQDRLTESAGAIE